MPQNNSLRHAVGLVLLVAGAAFPQSQLRTIQQIEPRGAPRGTQIELTLTGYGLGTAQDLLFYRSGLRATDFRPTVHDQEGKSTLQVLLSIDENCPLGEHPIRVRTRTGITSLHTFYVGAYPHILESAQATTFEKPQQVSLNCTVRGRIGAVGEVDWYALRMRAHQHLAVDVQAVRLAQGLFDGHLAIFDPTGRVVAEVDDTGLGSQDPMLSIVVPQAGLYRVAFRESGYGNEGSYKGPVGRYLLHVGSFPRPLAVFPAGGRPGETLACQFLGDARGTFTQQVTLPEVTATNAGIFQVSAERDGSIAPTPHPLRVTPHENVLEVEPNDVIDRATPTGQALPLAFNGVISKKRDVDCFRFRASQGVQYVAQVFARRIRSQLDSVLTVQNLAGQALVAVDDPPRRLHTSMFHYNTHHAGWFAQDSYVAFQVPEDGEYIVRVADQLKKGGPDFHYRVELQVAQPRVHLWVRRNPPYWRATPGQSISVPRGNRYATILSYHRSYLQNGISVRPQQLPTGIRVTAPQLNGRSVTTYAVAVPIVFEAAADAPLGGLLTRFESLSSNQAEAVQTNYEQSVYYGLNPPNYCFYGVDNDRLAVAVAEEFPVKLRLVVPRSPLVQEGRLTLQVETERDPEFKPPVRLELLYVPPGIAANVSDAVPAGQGIVEIPLEADRSAPVGSWPIVVVARTATQLHGGGVSTQIAPLEVVAPYLDLAIERAAVRLGQTARLTAKIEQKISFSGSATVELMGLPAGVTSKPAVITHQSQQVLLFVQVAENALVGLHKTLYCRVTLQRNGQPVVHHLGRGGALRIEPTGIPDGENR
jgi:hypothetical protein